MPGITRLQEGRRSRTKDPALGQWVKKTRSSQGTKLTPQQKARLTILGFDWETKQEKEEKRWDEMLEKLKEYRRDHLDCCVPTYWPTDPQLGKWVKNQREKETNNKLPLHHKQKLDAINFRWRQSTRKSRNKSAEDQKWLKKYQMLATYQEEHGDCLVPDRRGADAVLARWVCQQRKTYHNRKLEEERKKWLDEIGFVYKVDQADLHTSRMQKHWEEMFQHLAEFQKDYGHVYVKRSYSKWGLGKWVSVQRNAGRKGRIDPLRAERLRKIGITWGKSHDERWEEGFAMLVKYGKKCGHCRVPRCDSSNGGKTRKDGIRKLYFWVQNQQAYQAKGVLLPERKERLDAIGFHWRCSRIQSHDYCSDEEDDKFSSKSKGECDIASSTSERDTKNHAGRRMPSPDFSDDEEKGSTPVKSDCVPSSLANQSGTTRAVSCSPRTHTMRNRLCTTGCTLHSTTKGKNTDCESDDSSLGFQFE